MFKIASGFLAAALTVATCVVSAQEKSDMFGQEAVNVGDVGTPASQRKVISNVLPQRAAAVAPAVQPNVQSAARREANTAPSEFQKFIADNTGKMLPIFGAEFFAAAPSTFAPILNSPVPADYPLGPGDELLIRGWGTIDIDYRATIDRNGTIAIPSIGSIVLAGVKAGEAEAVIRASIGKLYKGVTVNVNFGQLRAITVYVVGQASRPGTYTVSSLSTLVTALFASGGPNSNGSMRRVQVKRGARVVAELDLYSFIAKGDKSADIKLQDGDTIFIPPAGGYVALVGKVNAPAIYELKTENDTIGALLDFAGGLPVVADPRRVFLERIDPARTLPRSVDEFALDAAGLRRGLKNGDVLNVLPITPEFANAVVLRGNVVQPVRAPFKSGMRVSDIIPSREYLLSRNSIKRQNNVVATGDTDQDTREQAGGIASRIGGLVDEINWDYAVIERINKADLSVSLVPFNLGNVFDHPDGPDNVQLQPGDTVTIFSQSDVEVPIAKRRVFVRVEGEVKIPGVYQMSAGETLQTLLAKAGGPTANAYLFGTEFYRDSVRREQEANLERATRRLEAQLRSEETKGLSTGALASGEAPTLLAVRQDESRAAREAIARLRQLKPSGRIAFALDPTERSFARLPAISLRNGDRLVLPAKPEFVHVLGAVNAEASPLWRPNMRVNDYLEIAGLASNADLDNVFVLRVDGTVLSHTSHNWFFGGIGGVHVMPGDNIVVPEKFDQQSAWGKFVQGAREWSQIFANFGLGAAAIKTLRN